MLGVFAPDGPAGLELEPDAFGGNARFPVQVRFQCVHPTGHVLQVPETTLGDVLRYRNGSTRFDLLLRGRAVDKIVGIFSQRGVPLGAVFAMPPMMPPMMAAVAASAAHHQHHHHYHRHHHQQQQRAARGGVEDAATLDAAGAAPPLPPLPPLSPDDTGGSSEGAGAPPLKQQQQQQRASESPMTAAAPDVSDAGQPSAGDAVAPLELVMGSLSVGAEGGAQQPSDASAPP